jgi:hypothetical protein
MQETKKCVVEFDKVVVGSGERLEVSAKTASECLLTRLIIPDEIAHCFEVLNIKIREISQLRLVEPTTAIPGAVFSESITNTNLKLDAAHVNDLVTLTIRNAIQKPCEFRARFEGVQVQPAESVRSFEMRCCRCKQLLESPGALLFGTPGPSGQTQKLHLCTACYLLTLDWLQVSENIKLHEIRRLTTNGEWSSTG